MNGSGGVWEYEEITDHMGWGSGVGGKRKAEWMDNDMHRIGALRGPLISIFFSS